MTDTDKRDRRLTIMSAALDFHKKRVANVARRSRLDARAMRFATDAPFLIATVKIEIAQAAQRRVAEENVRKSQADLAARYTPAEREGRCRSILREIEELQYKPLGIRIGPLRDKLNEELAALRALDPVAVPQMSQRAALAVVLAGALVAA